MRAGTARCVIISWESLTVGQLALTYLIGNKTVGFTPPRPLNSDPGSQETFETIRSWAQHCWTKHPQCVEARKKRLALIEASRSIPTRLVEVGPIGGGNVVLRDILPSINQDTDISDQHTYAALSYCWGDKNDNVRTLKGNLDEFRYGITLANLPNTIQEAIYVARAIGLPYIWIDALCIIQDDEEDKKRELPKMAAIYAGAMVVLSAAVAESCRQGFLHHLKISDLLRTVYRLPYYPTREGSREGFCILSEGPINGDEVVEPIDKRGWTLQECVQAVSLLRFGSRQVRWTCSTSTENDGGNDVSKTSEDLDSEVFDGSYHEGVLTQPEYLSSRAAMEMFCDEWRRFVEKYTTRSLSEQSDSLPAIGAMAQNYAQITKGKMGRYCAGLWEKDLARQLLWFKPNPSNGTKVTRLKPSWTWSSLPGSILYPALHLVESSVEIINCILERHDQNWSYGSVASGVLTIDAHLRPLFWSDHPYINTEYHAPDDEISPTIDVYWDTDIQWDLEHLFCMEILSAANEVSKSKGLILHRLTDGNFERLGYYECPGWLVTEFDSTGTGISDSRITIV